MTARQDTQPTFSFVHIPKNAGKSIRQVIKDQNLPILVSNHFYPEKMTEHEIVVIRCPISRFKSAFYYGKKNWPSPINANFSTASELAESAADPSNNKYDVAWIELGNKPDDIYQRNLRQDPQHSIHGKLIRFSFIYEPQSSWLINQPEIILRYSQIEGDFRSFVKSLGYSDQFTLGQLNKSESLSESSLSPKACQFIHETYRSDFEFIDSLGFDV